MNCPVSTRCINFAVNNVAHSCRRLDGGALTLLPTVTDTDATPQVHFFPIIAGIRRHIYMQERI